jgi:hypothetical protein
MQDFAVSLFVTTVVWLFNLEYGSGMGHVWLRPNDKNEIVFAWRPLITLLIQPFVDINMWKFANWDINFYTLFAIVYGTAKILSALKP